MVADIQPMSTTDAFLQLHLVTNFDFFLSEVGWARSWWCGFRPLGRGQVLCTLCGFLDLFFAKVALFSGFFCVFSQCFPPRILWVISSILETHVVRDFAQGLL